MTDFDPDSELEPEEEEEESAPEQSSNRTFLIVAIGLGGLFLVGMICIGLYIGLVAPRQQDASATRVAEINAANTQVAIDAALTANPITNTPVPSFTVPPTDTEAPSITNTPVIAPGGPTDTATVTNTSGPTFTPSRTPTAAQQQPGLSGGAGTGTPTRVVGVGGATVTPTFTRTATSAGTAATSTEDIFGGGAGVTASPTALPNTGFADEVGGPGLFIAALVLVAVVFVVRRLRLQNS
jgi:type II secretory pathway pseudopilin PulG